MEKVTSYRVKITNCMPQIDNIYDLSGSYIIKEQNEIFLDVKTEEEAKLIEELEQHQTESRRIYNELLMTLKL